MIKCLWIPDRGFSDNRDADIEMFAFSLGPGDAGNRDAAVWFCSGLAPTSGFNERVSKAEWFSVLPPLVDS